MWSSLLINPFRPWFLKDLGHLCKIPLYLGRNQGLGGFTASLPSQREAVAGLGLSPWDPGKWSWRRGLHPVLDDSLHPSQPVRACRHWSSVGKDGIRELSRASALRVSSGAIGSRPWLRSDTYFPLFITMGQSQFPGCQRWGLCIDSVSTRSTSVASLASSPVC